MLSCYQIPAAHLSGDIQGGMADAIYKKLYLRDPAIKLLYVTPEKVCSSFSGACVRACMHVCACVRECVSVNYVTFAIHLWSLFRYLPVTSCYLGWRTYTRGSYCPDLS